MLFGNTSRTSYRKLRQWFGLSSVVSEGVDARAINKLTPPLPASESTAKATAYYTNSDDLFLTAYNCVEDVCESLSCNQ